MHVLHIRILLIVSLAASTPAWCCCAVRAATVGGGEMPSCCAAKSEAARAAACCQRAANPASDDCESECDPCPCSDREVDQQRLDTSPRLASLGLPTHDLVTIAPEAAMPIGADAMSEARAGMRSRRGPPAWSLLDQGCLLLL